MNTKSNIEIITEIFNLVFKINQKDKMNAYLHLSTDNTLDITVTHTTKFATICLFEFEEAYEIKDLMFIRKKLEGFLKNDQNS